MSVKVSAGIKASRIKLSCHLLSPDLAVPGWDTASAFLFCSPVLTVRGIRVGVMTELTLGHFVSGNPNAVMVPCTHCNRYSLLSAEVAV